MSPMSSMMAMRQYQQVSVQSEVTEASPHRLIQMLMDGCLSRLAQARGAIERHDVPRKGELIGKSMGIIGGLREALDLEKGGEIAANLDRLYEYMLMRLLDANSKEDIAALDEVSGLMHQIKDGWDGIATQAA